jgi:hypothetical protein
MLQLCVCELCLPLFLQLTLLRGKPGYCLKRWWACVFFLTVIKPHLSPTFWHLPLLLLVHGTIGDQRVPRSDHCDCSAISSLQSLHLCSLVFVWRVYFLLFPCGVPPCCVSQQLSNSLSKGQAHSSRSSRGGGGSTTLFRPQTSELWWCARSLPTPRASRRTLCLRYNSTTSRRLVQ